jgi:hypothetical protein
MTFIEKVMPTVLVLVLLSVPFLIYNQIKRTNQCEENGGLLIKSASGWTCVELRKAQEK